MFRQALRSLNPFRSNKKLVGQDSFGNKFFVEELDAGQQAISGLEHKRSLEYPGNEHYDPNAIHLLWKSWLHYNKEEPPTEAEIRAFDIRMRDYKRRVAEYEEEDAKLRLQEIAARRSEGRTHSEGPSAQAFGQIMQKIRQDPTLPTFDPASAPPKETTTAPEEDTHFRRASSSQPLSAASSSTSSSAWQAQPSGRGFPPSPPSSTPSNEDELFEEEEWTPSSSGGSGQSQDPYWQPPSRK